MRIVRKIILPVCVILLAAGCTSKPSDILSGDSAQEMQMSIMRVARDLPPDRKDEFERAVETIMLSSTDRGLSVGGSRLTPQAMSLLKGLTANQVIESAKLIRSASSPL